MTIAAFLIGTATVTVTFRKLDDQSLYDPASPQLVATSPRKQTTPALSRVSTGIYSATVDFDVVGLWSLAGKSLGSGEIASTTIQVLVSEG